MSFLDNLRHKAVEESHDKCVDVRTIDIGIGHDDNLVISQLFCISLFAIFTIYSKAYADTLDDIHNGLSLKDFVPLYFFYIQNFTAQRKNCLMESVATLFCGTASRVTLDKENLAFLRILDRAVCKFSWETATSHEVLSLYAFTSFAGCDTCCRCQNYFFANTLSFIWVFFQIICQSFIDSLLNGTLYFAVT